MNKIRLVTAEDMALLQKWLEAGPYWQGECMTESMLFGPHVASHLFSDDAGDVASTQAYKIVRFHMQFKPESQLRIARMMKEMLPVFENHLKAGGYNEMVFSSPSPEVTRLFTHLGFKPRPNEYSKYL